MTDTRQPASGAEPPEEVAYLPGNATNNAILLMIMRPLWNYRCYWCNEPTAFRQMAVDHIIPRTATDDRLTELTTYYGLPADFDVHHPGNLAPICTPCNTKKSSSDYGHLPMLADHLKHAAQVAAKVVRQKRSFGALNELGPALLKLLSADLDDPETRTAMRLWVPDLLHTAAALDHEAVGDVVARRAELDLGLDFGPVTLGFTWRTSTAADLLEQVTGLSLPDALEQAVDQLVTVMCRRVQDGLAHVYGSHGPVSAGQAEADDATITFTTVAFARTDTSLDIAFTGALHSQFETTLTQSMFDGDGLEDLHAETEATGRFSLAVSCELADPPARPEVTDMRITRWDPTTLLWNSTELSYVNYDEPA